MIFNALSGSSGQVPLSNVLRSMGIAYVLEAAQSFRVDTENGAIYGTLGCCTLCS